MPFIQFLLEKVQIDLALILFHWTNVGQQNSHLFLSQSLLLVVAMIAGTVNSVAGGGSFFTVPTMIFANMPPVLANTTSTVALWPGAVASAAAYRRELKQILPILLITLIGASLIGGVLGAILLLHTPDKVFVLLLPYLLLMATLLFCFSGFITRKLRARKIEASTQLSLVTIIGTAIAQFIIAIYGGFFGGGIGILMLATLALMGMENIHRMNALKTVLGACINGVAVVTFIAVNKVVWPTALWMILGTTIGGYGGAILARKVGQKWIRLFVMIVGFAMSIYLFFH